LDYSFKNEIRRNPNLLFDDKPVDETVLARLLFGTSGWSYKEWVGPFYHKAENMFSYYAKFFNTVEINSTFYRYPSRATIYGLNRTSPENFVFSAKLPKLITHEKRLNPDLNVKSDLLRFLELLEPLKARGKLGCLLIQLPPSFIYERDVENLKAFLEVLPEDYEFAAEFRDHSWLRDETWKMLKKYNVAYCIVDEPLLPPEVHVTADFAYFRWHGRGTMPWYDYHYSEEELREWVPRIRKTTNRVDKVYGYFNNHYHGFAIENCIEILEMLNAAKPEHSKVKERIIRHNVRNRPMMYEMKLEEFGVQISELSVEDLLLRLTDRRRFKRGTEIGDEEVDVLESLKGIVKAKVRDYIVEVNFKERTLRHNCEDWRKGLGIKRFCKHLVKVFTTINPEESENILRDILENKEGWRFQYANDWS